MNVNSGRGSRPILKTKGFSKLHIELFEQILYSGKTNWDINLEYGYTKRSHTIISHTRKVMFKLLAFENLKKDEYMEQVIYPRTYHLWWKRLMEKHKTNLTSNAIEPEYYDTEIANRRTLTQPKKSGTWNNYYLT